MNIQDLMHISSVKVTQSNFINACIFIHFEVTQENVDNHLCHPPLSEFSMIHNDCLNIYMLRLSSFA